MRGTNHPGIVKLLSFSESDEYYFLVLERASVARAIPSSVLPRVQ